MQAALGSREQGGVNTARCRAMYSTKPSVTASPTSSSWPEANFSAKPTQSYRSPSKAGSVASIVLAWPSGSAVKMTTSLQRTVRRAPQAVLASTSTSPCSPSTGPSARVRDSSS